MLRYRVEYADLYPALAWPLVSRRSRHHTAANPKYLRPSQQLIEHAPFQDGLGPQLAPSSRITQFKVGALSYLPQVEIHVVITILG